MLQKYRYKETVKKSWAMIQQSPGSDDPYPSLCEAEFPMTRSPSERSLNEKEEVEEEIWLDLSLQWKLSLGS